MKAARLATHALAAGLALASCAPVAVQPRNPRPAMTMGAAPVHNLAAGCVGDYRPGTDYFPEKTRFTHSAQLAVRYGPNWKRVAFTPAVDTREVLRFVLVQCGTPAPRVEKGETLVEVPVRSFATANRSMLGAAALLGVEDRLTGIDTRFSSVPAIQRRIDDGRTAVIHAAGHGNGEQAAAVGADLFFTFYSAYPDANVHPLLRRLGVVSAPQSDHTEPTPLGRAEWIKFLALFVNGEARANALFANRVAAYDALAARVRASGRSRPLVQAGYPESRDLWSQAGGRNQLHRLIEDAGGRHAWHDQPSTGSWTFAPVERVYARAGDADIWIANFGVGPATMADLRRELPRYAWMKPLRSARVYWFDAGKVGPFVNAWSDQGMTEPQQALAELIAILHPGTLPPVSPRFIRHVPGHPE